MSLIIVRDWARSSSADRLNVGIVRMRAGVLSREPSRYAYGARCRELVGPHSFVLVFVAQEGEDFPDALISGPVFL
jgi:hypothetical protein